MALMSNISPTTGKPARKYTKAKRSATTAAQKQTGIKRQGRQRQANTQQTVILNAVRSLLNQL